MLLFLSKISRAALNKAQSSCTSLPGNCYKKEALALTMDLINSLMREVECEEKVAKQEAASSSLDIIAKANKLKQLRREAKETHDMCASEIYGRKVNLAMDLKDLRLRVSGVLNEGGKYVGVLDQVCRDLKERLTMVLIEKEFADREKLEKESYAAQALASEESKMQKEVEMSRRLTREAALIPKLQKSLKPRGQMVDMLDEVVSDQCDNVNLVISCMTKQIKCGKSHVKALSF